MRRAALLVVAVLAAGMTPVLIAAPAGADTSGPTSSSSTGTPASGATGSGTATPGASISADATVRVLSVSPNVPPSTTAVTPLMITLSVTNTSAVTLSQLRLDIVREPPISSTEELQKAIANPVESKSQPFKLPSVPVDGQLEPKASRTIRIPLTTSTDSTAVGSICLCRTGVYPLDFSLHAAGGPVTGTPERGWAQTYVPSTGEAQMSASWLWPLLDRPHRMTSDTTFIDDDLVASVVSGGRLDRALAALELAPSIAQVTLVLDPELLDELIVMSEGYRVAGPNGTTRVGGGTKAAELWLNRFKIVLAAVGRYSLTPYADPDVDALTRAGMTYSATMPAAMAQRLSSVLGITDHHEIAWPAGQTITSAALGRVVGTGAAGLVLDDATVPGSADSSGGHVVLPGTSATALVGSAPIASQVNAALDRGGSGAAALPALVSSALMPALDETNGFVVLAPDRYVDADPMAAAAAIGATSTGPFQPISATAALTTVDSYPGGALAEPPGAQNAEVSPNQLATVRTAAATSVTLAGALTSDDAASVLNGFPEGVQRAESSAWRADRVGGATFASTLLAASQSLNSSIRIVTPSNRSYSLASNDSPLLLTVQNTLTVPVSVRVAVASASDVKGFTAESSDVQSIPAGQQRTVRVQAHVERSGHFAVVAALTTPGGAPLGPPERLSIYSRALGTIGIVITVVAGSVLAVALLIRFTTRFRRRRQRVTGTAAS